MYLYSIYAPKESKNDNLLVIKQSFSIWAIIFNLFWAIYHKMWLIAIGALFVNLITIFLVDSEILLIAEYFKFVISIFVFGFFSVELREFYAKKRGLELDDIILANSEEEAESKYIMRKNIAL